MWVPVAAATLDLVTPRAPSAAAVPPARPRPEPRLAPDEPRRWAALRSRDAEADGTFVYSVATTGVYCRPSCGARSARPENVAFHASPEAAERAGFRACKRCQPKEPPLAARRADVVRQVIALLDGRESIPSLGELAESLGLSASHLHRVFKAATGLTPKAYGEARRAERVRDELVRGGSVTEALYGAGFGSSARFYAKSKELLGMTPTAYREGGVELCIRFSVGACWLGAILVAATDLGVCAILLGDDPEALARDLERRFPRARLRGGDESFDRVVAEVVGFVEAPRAGATLPLDVRGTAFQQRVWAALAAVPPGETTTYGGLARALGAPKAFRAVARACAANPLAVAIPCHRVVRTDSALSGYRWGVERKRKLLVLEAKSAASGDRR